MEPLQVLQLDGEVDLLGGRPFQLGNQIVSREHESVRSDIREFRQGEQVLHERNILGHLLCNARPTHLDGDDRAVVGGRLVNLRDRCRPERLFRNRRERCLPGRIERSLNALDHGVERHRGHIGTQLFEGVAVPLRKQVAAIRGDLADLHVRRPEILKNGHGFFGSQPRHGVMLQQNLPNLLHAFARRFVLYRYLGNA